MIELPTKKIKASRKNPKKIIIFGNPKVGKTVALSELDNCLTIDLEDGTELFDMVKINILQIAKKENKEPIVVLKTLINKIKESNNKKNGYIYKYIAIDTVSALETLVLPLAGKLYQNTSLGKN